jgi:hypothetical protein
MGAETMKKARIFVLVKNFGGVNHDAELYSSLAEARRGFAEYAGFGYSREYCDPGSPKYKEKFSETKIFELDMPDILRPRRTKQKG